MLIEGSFIQGKTAGTWHNSSASADAVDNVLIFHGMVLSHRGIFIFTTATRYP